MLETHIDEWRNGLAAQKALSEDDRDELEDHLRNEIEALQAQGLDGDEAFLISVRRMGQSDAFYAEFAREHSERLWKSLFPPLDEGTTPLWTRELFYMLLAALSAALSVQLPRLFGLSLDGPNEDQLFFARNFSFFSLPFLALFLAWKRDLGLRNTGYQLLPFLLIFLILNTYPFSPGGHTEILAVIHVPMALWIAGLFTYSGGRWRQQDQRMHFIRYSGEWFIYMTLIALGGGVLTAVSLFLFEAIGLNAEMLMSTWVLPSAAAGAVIVAAWLVENKQSVIENMAPVLTMIFSPLFTLLLLTFLLTMLLTGQLISVDRELLIGFDLLLVVVTGLLLYSISARDTLQEPGFFDYLQFILILSALTVDALALWVILSRISEFGFTPNRVAALGENLILVVNLSWSGLLYGRFIRRRGNFEALARWQTDLLPVYGIWAAAVTLFFPLIFRFI